jgi:hypothetical protein
MNRPFNPNRAFAGKRAKSAGALFEHALDKQHETYAAIGTAVIAKCHAETGGRPAKDGRGPALFFKGRAPVDFAGVLRGGRAVFIEAKYTALYPTGNPHGGLRLGGSGLGDEQVAELRARADLGALCLVLWFNGRHTGVFVVPKDWRPEGSSLQASEFLWYVGEDWYAEVCRG